MKKAQVWYLDFLIGILVILVISVIFYQTLAQIFHQQDVFQLLKKEGTNIVNSLMSEPYRQTEWSSSTPIGRIGLVENSKINNEALCELANLDYKTSQYLLGTDINYAVNFFDKTNTLILFPETCSGRDIIGPAYVTSLSALNEVPGSKIQLIRFVYYNPDEDGKGEIAKMVVSLWR